MSIRRRCSASHRALPLLLAAGLLLPVLLSATPYVDPAQLNEEFAARQRSREMMREPDRAPRPQPFELDEHVYAISLLDILDWLTLMQELEPGEDYGGMHEGEEDWDVIQTDNTQEALRDWAHYARMTGDTGRFRENIDAAWRYIMNFPAYSEEGGGNPNYYRVHNCGWGLVATIEYTEAYDDDSYLEYGDSCAAYLDTYRLDFDDYVINPLAAAFGAGTLYMYGVWRDNLAWKVAARSIATNVRNWIEEDPDRLNDYETWAMSGGTAMWGVISALYLDNPAAGEEWIPQYTTYLDTIAGTGQWNNAWSVWYCHAWHQVHRVLEDQGSYTNAVDIVDHLLDQDRFDRDGGIPATEDEYENDQSWTSAYLAWYGIEPILEGYTPQHDVTLLEMSSPNPVEPLRSGDPVMMRVIAGNAGLLGISGAAVSMTDGEYTGRDTVDIPFGMRATATLDSAWTPQGVGDYTLTFIIDHPDDEDRTNDTLNVDFEILPAVTISGSIHDLDTYEGIPARIDCYRYESNPDSVYYTSRSEPDRGDFHVEAIPGTYRLEISPLVAPYNPRTLDSLMVDDNGRDDVDLGIPPAPVMIVAEDHRGYESYIYESLELLSIDTYVWKTYERGYPYDTLSTARCIIWSTGDLGRDNQNVFPPSNWTAINRFLDTGGSMLVTGQNIQDRWGGYTILRSRFGAYHGELGLEGNENRFLTSAPDNELIRGDSLSLRAPVGYGANNQVAPDEVVPVNGAFEILTYGHSDIHAAVAFEHESSQYKTVFCGFGVEAIPSVGSQYMTRHEFLNRVLAWFEIVSVDHRITPVPLPESFSLQTWPNPFNPTLQVRLQLPEPGPVSVRLFDILGRKVTSLHEGVIAPGVHRFTWRPENAASGVYFIKVNTDSRTTTEKVILLR